VQNFGIQTICMYQLLYNLIYLLFIYRRLCPKDQQHLGEVYRLTPEEQVFFIFYFYNLLKYK